MANDKLRELQELRMELAGQIRGLAECQDQWTAEQEQQWGEVNERYDQTCEQIEEMQRQDQIEARMALLQEHDERIVSGRRTEIGESRAQRRGQVTQEHRALALQAWMRAQSGLNLSPRHQQAAAECRVNLAKTSLDANIGMRQSPVSGYQMWESAGPQDWKNYDQWHQRANEFTEVGTDAHGGYTVPTDFMVELEKTMLAFGGPRRVCRIIRTAGGNSMPWPVVDDTGNSAAILAESTTIGESVSPDFSVVTFEAYKFNSGPVLVSQELIEDSAFNIATIVAQLLGERIGRGQAAYLATGTGSSQPQGIITGAGAGKTLAATNAVTADELIDLQAALDPAYESLPSIGWMFHKSTLTAIRKLKSATEEIYLWQPGLRLGEPDLLLGDPYTVCNDLGELSDGAGTRVIVYGAMEKFVIRDAGAVRFYRLEERYRDLDVTGFVSLARMDSHVINSGALLYGITAAS